MRVRSINYAASTVAAALGVGAVGGAGAQELSREELANELAALRAKVERLEAAQQTQGERLAAREVDTTVAGVLEDADRRSQLLQTQGFTAGYDKGFVIQSEDKNFVLRPGIQTQFRYVANYSDADANEGDEGFELRRLRLRFEGNAFSPDLTYLFQWDTNRSGGNVQLLDAWAQYRFRPEWAVKFGQFKESVFHERDVSGFAQLAVDRTLVDAVLGGANTDRVQGVALVYGGTKDNPLRAELAYHDGANSRNTNFQDAGTDFGVGGRVEYKAFGQWSEYRDLTAKGGTENLLLFGGGADFTQADAADVLRSTADVQFETAEKLAVYGAVHLNYTEPDDDLPDADSATDYGALAQVGYLVTKQLELFGRYDVVLLDEDTAGGEDTFNEITVGANYYLGANGIYLHKAKVSLDVVYLPDGSPSAQTSVGAVAGEEDQVIFRGQFQLIL